MDTYVITTRQDHSSTDDSGRMQPMGSVTGVEGVYSAKPYFDKLAAVCISMETGVLEVLREGGADTSKVTIHLEEDTDWSRRSVLTCGNVTITTRVAMHKCELQ